ncbi:MAG: hypothetical protein CMC82_02455 [Flavobacteriaceae bacterium]|nr:hypothetical protein [Flavobacteriaceae bacterium]
MQDTNQNQLDRFHSKFEYSKYTHACLKDKLRRTREKLDEAEDDLKTFNTALLDIDVPVFYTEKLSTPVKYLEMWIQDHKNECSAMKERLQELDSDMCFYADKINLING